MTTIRPERPRDEDAVREVVRLAFGEEAEVRLVDALRRNRHIVFSLVAEDQNRLVGHIALSMMTIGESQAIALAPLAVVPQRQRQGIGSQLVVAVWRNAAALAMTASSFSARPNTIPASVFSRRGPSASSIRMGAISSW